MLSTLTRIVPPSQDHACIHKCRSDMNCRMSPLSLLPSQFLGMRSLIRYRFGAGSSVTLCIVVAMPFNKSSTDKLSPPRNHSGITCREAPEFMVTLPSLPICPFLQKIFFKFDLFYFCPHSTRTLDSLSSPFVCPVQLMTSCHCSRSLSSDKHHACRIFLIVSCFQSDATQHTHTTCH